MISDVEKNKAEQGDGERSAISVPPWIYVMSVFSTSQRNSTQISLTEELYHLDTRRIIASFDTWKNRLREAQKFAYGPRAHQQ